MRAETFVKRSRIPAPVDFVFRWHANPGAIERLTPPWERVEILDKTGGIEEPGSRLTLATRIGPFKKRWVAEHRDYVAGRQFRDVQVEGPFARWEHTHRFEPDGEDACILEDHIEYALPAGALGRAVGGGLVRGKLDAMFRYRHETTSADVLSHRGTKPRRVAVTGARGLVGAALLPFLTTGGHTVQSIGRRAGWDFSLDELSNADAVVHLAGESIVQGRWNAKRKARIRDSRVEGTRRIAAHLARMERPPVVLVCASAVGFYGDRGDELLSEESAPGTGFLADVCRAWEEAAAPALERGIRVVHLRFGVVLSPRGGALAKMLPPFRLGLGGRIGSGRQYVSWIGIDDAVGAIHHAIATDSLRGPVNAVAPAACTNRELTRVLARVLRRPAVLPMPAFAARLAFGEVAGETILPSARAHPARLERSGYRFRDPSLESCLRRLLGKTSS